MLSSAHQGYIYQDILSAYFIAQAIANGNDDASFIFDAKKTPVDVKDKFDDIAIFLNDATHYIQVKYSNETNNHVLTKDDFANSASYDLALFDLFETWKTLNDESSYWHVCLAWKKPIPDDPILSVLRETSDSLGLVPTTVCYKFDCDLLWPADGEVQTSWRALRDRAQEIDRKEFVQFLDQLVIEVECPKTSLLEQFDIGIEKYLFQSVERIGVGEFPNDHLSIQEVIQSLCSLTRKCRSKSDDPIKITIADVYKEIRLIRSFGGVEQKFTVDENVFVSTPKRVAQVKQAIEDHKQVVLTAEPGAGKSWFLEDLQKQFEQDGTLVIKHYCYVALEDPLLVKRITTNVLYGSLIAQIKQHDETLSQFLPTRFSSNLNQLNALLAAITSPTLLVVDGIDHIWRVYQRNNGGLTEDETKILEALSKLYLANPCVSILVVSQPIDQLDILLSSYHHASLIPLDKEFVQQLMAKNSVPNIQIEATSLTDAILTKCNGNALYCKYLIDHAVTRKSLDSISWIEELPPYNFNLADYYEYLYRQISGERSVAYALCGASFSLTNDELREITQLGALVEDQINILRPILRVNSVTGSAIYHESFKRFSIDKLRDTGASIERWIYRPLIEWLESLPFFESTKAFGHLLKFYFEVAAIEKIRRTIDINFFYNALCNAQPFANIIQNHKLQQASISGAQDFSLMLIVTEQSKLGWELENIEDDTLISYLQAVQQILGDEYMYRVFMNENSLAVDHKTAIKFLTHQAYKGQIVHWAITPRQASIPYELLGFEAVKLLHSQRFRDFETFVNSIFTNSKHTNGRKFIFEEVDQYRIHLGSDWLEKTPYFRNLIENPETTHRSISDAVDAMLSDKSWRMDEDQSLLREIVFLSTQASQAEIESVTQILSNYNWFRYWLIYLIRFSYLAAQSNITQAEILSTFSYLVRDLAPYKGEPRAAYDLFYQEGFIRRSFHWGLQLCNGDQALLEKCLSQLERVTELGGPLPQGMYLALIDQYLSSQHAVEKFNKYYDVQSEERVYAHVAEFMFAFASVLDKDDQLEQAKQRFQEGVRALIGYGFRKDRTLSEILYCSVPYQQAYGTLDPDWFYRLLELAHGVVAHTDGRSTNRYPNEWFDEFIKIYPDEALRFLVTRTLENSEVEFYEENDFLHILEEHKDLFSPTQWFLLCKSLPLAASDKIVSNALSVKRKIDSSISHAYIRWLKQRPFIDKKSEYSSETANRFFDEFGISIDVKEKTSYASDNSVTVPHVGRDAILEMDVEQILAFLEKDKLTEAQSKQLEERIQQVTDWQDVKSILRAIAKTYKYGRDLDKWLDDFFLGEDQTWLYFNLCLFVYVLDGWFTALSGIHFFQKAYRVNPNQTTEFLYEILADAVSEGFSNRKVACNLVVALASVNHDQAEVTTIIKTIYDLVELRLPYAPNLQTVEKLHKSLEDFDRDELVVALLISRLKTLTTEKTQGVIWSLIYLARTAPNSLLRPYEWVFSKTELLLPIHRSLLLQILLENVERRIISDTFIALQIARYPTGYFLEDQLIRRLAGNNLPLAEQSNLLIHHTEHQYDEGFFIFWHSKYDNLVRHIGVLHGSYNAFVQKRNTISEEHSKYYIRSDDVICPIVSIANATYEIANSYYYDQLRNQLPFINELYTFDLDFYLDEMFIFSGSQGKRPVNIQDAKHVPEFSATNANALLDLDEDVVLAYQEIELAGEYHETKVEYKATSTLVFGDQPESDEDRFYPYRFRASRYEGKLLKTLPLGTPISRLEIRDNLEALLLLFVSPYVVKELGLRVSFNNNQGFQAETDNGDIVIWLETWKENYLGDISQGTEYPAKQGSAVFMKREFLPRLFALYKTAPWIVKTLSVKNRQ